MRRGWKIAIAALVVLIVGIFTLGVAARAGLLSNLATSLTNSVLGDNAQVKGLGGSFPYHVTADELTLRDTEGVYARLTGVTIDWSPGALFHGTAHIDRLHADRLSLLRLPQSKNEGGGGGFGLPVGVDVDALKIDQIVLSEAVAREKATLTLAGSVHLKSLQDGSVDVTLHRIGGPGGSYALSGRIDAKAITARLAVDEPAHGLIATAANLPDLGPIALHASMDGPRTAEKTELALHAGDLSLASQGTIDIAEHKLDLTVTGRAPAMAPAPDIAWQSASIDTHVTGTFTEPNATGTAEIVALKARGAHADRLTAQISGSRGEVSADAELVGLVVPGPKPDLLAGAPLKLHAQATLDTPSRPVTLTLSHPLLEAQADATTQGGVNGTLALKLPALAPFAAAAAKLDLQGHLALDGKFSTNNGTTKIAASGTLGITGGMPVAVDTIGSDAHIAVAASRADGAIQLDRLAIDGKTIRASANGARTAAGAIRLAWQAALTQLSAVAPTAKGEVTAHGTVEGQPEDLTLAADATIDAAFGTLPRQKVAVTAKLHGLPNAPAGSVTASGQLAGAPLRLATNVSRAPDGTLRLAIERADWKSATARGTLTLPAGASVPAGQVQLRFARLADLQPLLGEPITGSLTAQLATVAGRAGPKAQIRASGERLELDGTEVASLTLDGTIDGLRSTRDLDLALELDGIKAKAVTGRARLTVRGTAAHLALRLASTLNPPGEGMAKIDAAATADTEKKIVRLTAFRAEMHGKTVQLARPATVTFANGLAVDGLRLTADQAVLTASGRIAPKLDFQAAIRNVTPKLLSVVAPGGAASEGQMAMTARLGGTLAAPTGTVRITGKGFRGWAETRTASSAGFDATVELHGSWAGIEASFSAGNTATLRVAGRAPLDGSPTLDIKAAGRTDLALLDPFLLASGRRARGTITLDITARGALAHPEIAGDARLADGELQDYTQGILISNIAAEIDFANGVARIARFTGKAGDGTVALSGTVALLAPGIPVDITFTARNAKLPARDLVTAIMNADIHLRGQAQDLKVAGNVHITRADIQLPDHLPQSVAVLDVQKPGRTPTPAGPAFLLGLDIQVDAPERIFVRGHGLDAEMGGNLHIGGTTANPQVSGGFRLRRGNYSIAGKTLQFVSGTVSFDGQSLTGNLNPTLDFVAENTEGSITARLEITGYANDPQIKLSSSPELPQDEVLAHLLFAKSLNELTPIEIAQIGSALASIGGAGGGFNPLADVRKALGLDVLSVGGAGGSGGTTVEAGKYVANGIYVGTKEGIGGSSQAEVRIDLTKHLKLDTQLSATSSGPLTGATPSNDPGSSVGLTYQFEY